MGNRANRRRRGARRFHVGGESLELELRAFFAFLDRGTEADREAAPPTSPFVGKRLGDFRVLGAIGRGGMGLVFEAEQLSLGRRVALKVLDPSRIGPHSLERFQREARAAARLSHPGIVRILAFGEEHGMPYLAMECIDGITLASALQTLRPRDRRTARAFREALGQLPKPDESESSDDYAVLVGTILAQVAEAVEHGHRQGVIHRDLKPANILLRRDGTPVITDFGLARDADGSSLTGSGDVLGTIAYMSPELLAPGRKPADPRVDVYSLGVTLYEALTLRPPFDAEGRDQLVSQVLATNPVPPRKLERRLSRDAETIVLKAMDPDPARRYPSAHAMALDLRRFVRSEPIHARPPGVGVHLRRWMRRRPARAVAAGMLLASLLAGTTGALVQAAARRRVAWAEAARSREEATALTREYASVRREWLRLREEVSVGRREGEGAHVATRQRAELAWKERELNRKFSDLDRLSAAARDALERGARIEAPLRSGVLGPELTDAFATHFLELWKTALESGDQTRMELYAGEVRKHDRLRAHDETLSGSGVLVLEPGGTDVYLFRYVDHAALSPDRPVISRLVPVPTSGRGYRRETGPRGFRPGEICLVIRGIAPRSPAAAAGLEPGDLVLRVEGQPSGAGLLVGALAPEGPAARMGVRLLDPIELIDGHPVEGWFEWRQAGTGAPHRVVIRGRELLGAAGRSLGETFGLVPRTPLEIIAHPAPESGLRLTCLRQGEPVELRLASGEKAGMTCEVTAYPLVFSSRSRLSSGRLPMDPGSYLIVVRKAGYEDQRFPFVMPRGATVEHRITLLPDGSTPPGFCFVPGGAFVAGGDPQAFQSAPEERLEVPAFFMARREVTYGEWSEFVNDPSILEEIEEARREGRTIYLPRDEHQKPWRAVLGQGGRYVFPSLDPETPILSVTREDAARYVAWRNRRAEEAGEPWVFDLPTEEEWEKAARGVDARPYPWGEHFDLSLAATAYRKSDTVCEEPGGFEPRDESPYGVRDLAGSRSEWTRDERGPGSGSYMARGGSCGHMTAQNFRAATRVGPEPGWLGRDQGVRLVARPRKPGSLPDGKAIFPLEPAERVQPSEPSRGDPAREPGAEGGSQGGNMTTLDRRTLGSALLLALQSGVMGQLAWTNRSPAVSPPARESHGIVFDAGRGRVVLFGGAGTSALGDTWEWDGITWTQMRASPSPSPRGNFGIAYDVKRRRTVLYGGGLSGCNPLDDTWEWDGIRWTLAASTSPMGGRVGHALAFDACRGTILMFGGAQSGACQRMNDTWSWNGTTWTQLGVGGTAPPARSDVRLATDVTRGRVVLFGGHSGPTGAYLGDTWEWDGTTWTQAMPASAPVARILHGLTYDATRRVSVLFGGIDIPQNNQSDTWEWSGSAWNQAAPAASPPARKDLAIAFDSWRQRTVLFGGRQNQGGLLSDTWELFDPQTPACTVFGLGHCPGGLDLRCLTAPRIGSTLVLNFASTNPAGFNLLVLGPGPCLVPPVGIAPPAVCANACSFPYPAVVLSSTGNPAAFPLPIPNLPILRGIPFCVQGAAFEATTCFRLTLALRIVLQ